MSEYEDAFGRRCESPPETLRTICAALGYPAEDENAAQRSYDSLMAASHHPPTPPVVTLRGESRKVEVPISVQHGDGEIEIAWQVRLENGDLHHGRLRWSDLSSIDSAQPANQGPTTRRLSMPIELPYGYHDLAVRLSTEPPLESHTRLIAAPARAYQSPPLAGGARTWALSVQLYSLRSDTDWGVGDFGTLSELVSQAAKCGVGGIGLNPLHSLFLDEPERASPYAPSSRFFLNPLYLAIPLIDDFIDSPEARALVLAKPFQVRLAELRRHHYVDYCGVIEAKMEVLHLLYASFRLRHLSDPNNARARAFRAFQACGGGQLRRFAVYESLRARFGASDPRLRFWRHWETAYQTPDSPAIASYIERDIEQIEFFEYLQWQADLQLGTAAERARTLSMPIGLYLDLAIGADGGGADAWARQSDVVRGFSAGAPPDPWSKAGQNWGFPPFNPLALRQSGYRTISDVLRANMRHAGALRIDHVLGLMRMFWIPDDKSAAEGAYVHYPFDELIAVVILESHRNRCLVIGEDLGTVPRGLRTAMSDAGLFSYRLLYFERDDQGGFRRPDDYPSEAVAAATTHDLPTIAGYWTGGDIQLRERIGLLAGADECTRLLAERDEDRRRLLLALHDAGFAVEAARSDPPILAVHSYLARTLAKIAVVQIDDVLGVDEQINVPGTYREHPNWRRRLPLTLGELFADRRIHDLAHVVANERRSSSAIEQWPAAFDTTVRRRWSPPVATYRLQLSANFTFADVQRVLPYLRRLGISHVYTSPFMRARPHSAHGYDITNHSQLNPEIGDADDLSRLSDAMQALDMGLILDFVPNHMSIEQAENEWWLDVLEWGSSSPYAAYFDIDWESAKRELASKVLVPFLAGHYGVILERGELTLRFEPTDGTFSVRYHDHRLPIRPRHYALILDKALARDDGGPAHNDLRTLSKRFATLRPEGLGHRRQMEMRNLARESRADLARLATQPETRIWLERAADAYNGTPGQPSTYHTLHQLLERQAYRLAFWRVAAHEINYRRFFDINGLIGIRQEVAELFRDSHRLVASLIAQDKIQGLRIDHIDGLFDPAAYCKSLRDLIAEAQKHDRGGLQPPVMCPRASRFFVVVEKILASHERLRADWAVDGTTGYDFLALVNRLFIDPSAEAKIDSAFRHFVGDTQEFDSVLYASKITAMESLLASELNVLARELDRLSEQHWRTRDYTFEALRQALKEVVAYFPVYRTYIVDNHCTDNDRALIESAVRRAQRRWSGPDREIFDFVLAALTGDLAKDRRSGYNRNDVMRFAMKFQQYTAPVMAKGLEDTACYRYYRFLSVNEVGSEPKLLGVSPGAFHLANEERRQRWPLSLLATATHDTKRGEDARVRLDVLSEMIEEWRSTARRWRRFNRSRRQEVDGVRAPTLPDEFMIYQALIGAWPTDELVGGGCGRPSDSFQVRFKEYVVKALREAKLVTDWSNPNQSHEGACLAFVDAILDDRKRNLFLEDFHGFARRIAFLGSLNSLSQLMLKCFSPGIPDIYQGSELWDVSLVDPDNRRPVDFAARISALGGLADLVGQPEIVDPATAKVLMRDWPSGHIKLYALYRALLLRNSRSALFTEGDYEAATVAGARSQHVVAFVRRRQADIVVVVVGRLFAALLAAEAQSYSGAVDWADTSITLAGSIPSVLIDALTGRQYSPTASGQDSSLRVAELLSILPVSVLAGRSLQ